MNANTNSASPSEPAGSGVDPDPTVSDLSADPVDWEARYRAGDTPWDEGHAAPGLSEFLSHHPILGSVLVPGSGPGHDVRALAAQGADVVGLDLSPAAVTAAAGLPRAGGERHVQGDLFDLPPTWRERFDWVVEHTCFCAIPPSRRADYVRAVTSVLKPGAHYFAIFYLDPAAPQGPPHGTTRREISALFDPALTLLEEWCPAGAFEGREGREICQLRRKS